MWNIIFSFCKILIIIISVCFAGLLLYAVLMPGKNVSWREACDQHIPQPLYSASTVGEIAFKEDFCPQFATSTVAALPVICKDYKY